MDLSAIASMMVLPREGHLITVLQVLSFLKSKHNGVTVFDHSEPEMDLNQCQTED